jgi:hypothetical protein
MSEKLSKIILVIEMLMIMLPISLFFIPYGLSFGYYLFHSSNQIEYSLVYVLLFCLVAIIASWNVTIQFLLSGRTGTARLPIVWKVISYVAGLFVVFSWLVLIVHYNFQEIVSYNYSIALNTGIFGAPFIIPLVHMSIEWNNIIIRDEVG